MLIRLLALTSRAPRLSPPRLSAAGGIFDHAEWPQLQGELDGIPVFTVANEDGQPLQYQVGGQSLAIFYADVEAAKKQLADAQGQFPDLNYDMIPVGLGSAYRLSCDGKGMVVPGMAELQALGAPEDAQPMGQELPLFMGAGMSQETDEGPVLPLFMSHADCAAAVAKATGVAGVADEISGLALASVVEARLDDASSEAFSFVAPSASLQHVESYVGKGIYWRPVEED